MIKTCSLHTTLRRRASSNNMEITIIQSFIWNLTLHVLSGKNTILLFYIRYVMMMVNIVDVHSVEDTVVTEAICSPYDL